MKEHFERFKEVCGEIAEHFGFMESKGIKVLFMGILVHILVIIGIYTVNGIIVSSLDETMIKIIFTALVYIIGWSVLHNALDE